MTANRKQRMGTCPVCVEHKQLTKDHVPPKGLFLKPRPTNTITVFTCSGCNEGTKLDDEYFRLYIAATSDPDSHLMKLWREKVVQSTFKRSPALQAALIEEMDLIREQHKVEPLTTFDGRPLTSAEVENILPLLTERIDRVVTKIVRCLHFHHEYTVLPKETIFTVTVDPLADGETRTLVRYRSGLVGGPLGEFIYRYSGRGTRTWDWVLLFYLTHHFRVHVTELAHR